MTDRPRGKRGPAPGYGAKGGKRKTIRISEHAAGVVAAEAEATGKTESDVMGDVINEWAETRPGQATDHGEQA
jgi:hypothetical protein